MLLYLLAALVCQALANNCWNPARRISGSFPVIQGSFEDCEDYCEGELGMSCRYITYVPVTGVCKVETKTANIVDLTAKGYTFTTKECSKKPLSKRDACRQSDVLNGADGGIISRFGATQLECDNYCLKVRWCKATCWWAGGGGGGTCVATASPSEIRYFTADKDCLDNKDPCMAGSILHPIYGCVAQSPSLLKAIRKAVTCIEGKLCKVKFAILAPPAGRGIIIKRGMLRMCRSVDGQLKDCQKGLKRRNVFRGRFRSVTLAHAGDYVAYVDYNNDLRDISDKVTVTVNAANKV